MNTQQKLSYMLVGDIIGVVGTVIGMSVLSISAARNEFGWIVRARGHDGVSRAAFSVVRMAGLSRCTVTMESLGLLRSM